MDIANGGIHRNARGTPWAGEIYRASAQQEPTWIRSQAHGWVVRILLGEEDPPTRSNVNHVGASANDGPAAARKVVSKSKPRSEVVLIGIPHPVGVLSQLQESLIRGEIRKLVVGFLNRRRQLVAEAKIQDQPGRDAPVILKEPGHSL